MFARAPERGRVKTRLAAEVGDEAALAVYLELASGTVATARTALAAGVVTEVVVAFTPARARAEVEGWLGGAPLEFEAQGEGDLGARLRQAVAGRQREGAERVVVVGTDCPALTATRIAEAVRALDGAEVVLGPALDGGYYLVGVERPTAAALDALFEGVPWSTAHTLAVTLERAAAAGLRVQLLPPLGDVDTAADWQRWQRERALGGHDPAGR